MRNVLVLGVFVVFSSFSVKHTCEAATVGVTVLTAVVRTVDEETATKVATGTEELETTAGIEELVIAAGMEELATTGTALDVAGAEAAELGAADAQTAWPI